MTHFIQDLIAYMRPEVGFRLATALGVDRETIFEMVPWVAQLVLSGLKRQKDEHCGTDRIDQILNTYGSDQILYNLPAFLATRTSDRNVDSSLGGLLEDCGHRAAEMLSRQFELDRKTAGQIIPVVAPIILGFLTHRRKQIGIGLSGVSAILDQDGDSRLLDEIFGSFPTDDQPPAAKSRILAELLKGLTSASR